MKTLNQVKSVEDIESSEHLDALMEEIRALADIHTENVVNETYGGNWEFFPCGFAWVKVNADGRSKIGRMLKKSESFSPCWDKGFRTGATSGKVRSIQTMDIKEVWTRFAAEEMRKIGLSAFSMTRID